MKIHTVDIADLASLNCTDLRITSISRAADSADFSFCADSMNDLAPWNFGDKVQIVDNQKLLFSGYVTTCPTYSTESTSKSYSVKLENIVALMDATPYSEPQSFDGFITNDARLVSAREALVKLTNAGLVAPDGSTASETVHVDIDAEIMCPTGSGSQSCWSLANGCLHWVPDAVTWFSPETETLRIRRACEGDTMVLDLLDGKAFVLSESKATGWLKLHYAPFCDIGLRVNGVHVFTEEDNASPAVWADAINAADCGVIAAYDENSGKIDIVATVAGAAGNNISLELGKALYGGGVGLGENPNSEEVSGPFLTGGSDGENEIFHFAGYSSASFRERLDLCPPVVSVGWPDMGKEFIFPKEATSSRLPWAFRFEIPSSGGVFDPENPAQARAVQKAVAPKMTVSGFKVPAWRIDGKLTEQSTGKPGEFLAFWKRWFPLLGKLPYTGLVFGNLIFEPVAGEIAFPADEESGDSMIPANYEAFSNTAKSIYVLNEGSFPASTESRDNLSGLNFCKGRLKQMIWHDRSVDLTQYATAEELYNFFTGTAKLAQRTTVPKKCRFVQMELEAVFIDRHRKKFKVGTNELMDGDPDYEEPESDDGGGGGGASYDMYRDAAEDYYNATRQLFYDGEITLHGVKGYSPGQLQGAILNITGGRSEWESMATPVVQAEWSPFRKTLTLSTGSPEILTLDERVQRMQLGRQSAAGAGTSFAQPPSASGGASSGGEDEEKDFPMISPNISVSTVTTKEGKPLNPLSLFADGNSWKLSEGVIPLPGGKVLNFEEKDVTDIVAANPGAKLRVYPKYDRTTRQWEARVGIVKPKE